MAQDEPAQDDPSPEDLHAHKWKGIDVDALLESSNIPADGFEIYLYNVGTGRFIIEGGNWGMEGRLFHEDFGRPMYLMSDGFIRSGITEKTSDKAWFGCNASGAFHPKSWAEWNQYSYTIMMDGRRKDYRNRWNFVRVEAPTNTTTYTYYMYETSQKRTGNYYLGAAYGECHAPAWKGDGTLVHMDDDRATWTTINPIGVQDTYTVNGEEISLDKLYQWRVVSKEQFYEVLGEEVTGLNPSVAALIPDRDFVRNADNFETDWILEANENDLDYSYGRWGYTWGVSYKKTNGTYAYNSSNAGEAWNKPLRLKNVFENGNDYVYGWTNAKYGFLTFEGVGRIYTEFEVPRPGWYMVQCYGFIQSDANDAYIFARVKGSTTEGSDSKNNLVKVPSNTFAAKNNKNNCLEVGKVLTRPDGDKEMYKNTVWILVTEEQFNSGLKTLQIGVGKDAATKSENSTTVSGKECHYDTDWVCVDDFRASYLGLGPCFFYEDEEDLEYLRFDEQHLRKQFQSAVPNGRYSGATCLERTLNKNNWNSFSFPLPLTGEQVRYAFGEDAQLAKINSVGNLSKNPNVIDFETVSLFTTNVVVEPGHFYLLKPTKEPTEGIDPRGIETTYYELGRMFFSVNETEPETYKHERMSLNTKKVADQDIPSFDNNHNGKAHVNYVQTPNYNTIMETHVFDDLTHGIYADEGAYVVSNNTIFHINKNTPLKGFRGWIVLDTPIGPSDAMTMSVHNRFTGEKEDTSVESLPMVVTQLSADTEVYDLCGRKVGALGTTLPKGIYLVNGRKYFVK